MTAEEAMDRIGNVLEQVYAGNLTTGDALNQVAQIRLRKHRTRHAWETQEPNHESP